MKSRPLLLAILFVLPCFAQQHLVPTGIFDSIAKEFSGESAQEAMRQIIEYHRIQGSPMMAEVAEKVVLARLRAAGVEAKIEQFPSDGSTRYFTYLSPMGWEIRSAELWVESAGGDASFVPYRLCRYADVPMCVSTYSKGGEWSGDLVDLGRGTRDRDYEGKDVRGKVVLAYGYAGSVVRQAVLKRGAVGAVIYPAADDRSEHPDMVRYNGLWTRASEVEKTSGSFQISANQYTRLKSLMARGPVRVRGKIDATLGPGQLTVVHAWIRGSDQPGREVLISGHLDHPKWSANDNASGSAAMLEMVRSLATLIAANKLPRPRRTIHFLWVPEYFGTLAYVSKHPEVRACHSWDDPRQTDSGRVLPANGACVLANLNLDMVGEDTVKTNSRFYMTRAPDSVPSFLDALLADLLAQTREARLYAPTGTHNYWPAEMTPYVQGSDHDVFLGLGIPASMLGHDPDWTHHTSEDTPDKTDASEFRRVGVLATAAAIWLASADGRQMQRLATLGTADLMQLRLWRIGRAMATPDAPGASAALAVNNAALSRLRGEQGRRGDGGPFAVTATSDLFAAAAKLPAERAASGPRRLTLLPFENIAFEPLGGEDKKWCDEQAQRFSAEAPGGGLPVGPTFDLLIYETVNFMDGRRSTADIARLLSADFELNIEQAWVDRLVDVLTGLKLVAK
jgi:hypothetical protein